jgi:hypothetical protein
VWKELLSRLQRDLESPPKDAPFRGSLIDEKMFAIDVKEWGMKDLLQEQREQREPKIAEVSDAEPPAECHGVVDI